jgi:hypothetical protein
LSFNFVAARRVFAGGVFVLIQLTRNRNAKGIRKAILATVAPRRAVGLGLNVQAIAPALRSTEGMAQTRANVIRPDRASFSSKTLRIDKSFQKRKR